MHAKTGQSRHDLLSTILETVASVRPDAGTVGEQTHLVGSGAVLDSVGLVSLLISLEQRLGGTVDLASSLMDSAGIAEEKNPFRTVGSLADHIHQLNAAQT